MFVMKERIPVEALCCSPVTAAAYPNGYWRFGTTTSVSVVPCAMKVRVKILFAKPNAVGVPATARGYGRVSSSSLDSSRLAPSGGLRGSLTTACSSPGPDVVGS